MALIDLLRLTEKNSYTFEDFLKFLELAQFTEIPSTDNACVEYVSLFPHPMKSEYEWTLFRVIKGLTRERVGLPVDLTIDNWVVARYIWFNL